MGWGVSERVSVWISELPKDRSTGVLSHTSVALLARDICPLTSGLLVNLAQGLLSLLHSLS